ncbi:MAG: Spy/CpxP family protein refolding chaperone [Oligoflexia bacterium]|nr:Spy/CpxP family protein refolding chaperone [Oligoflexia bacterium]
MKNYMHSIIGTLVVAALLLPAGEALAKRGGKWDRGKMMSELNLTSEQKDKMKEIRSKNKDAIKAQREEMKSAREALEEAMKGNASDGDIRSKFEKVQAVQQKLAKDRFENVLAIRAILTPEQRAKFRDIGIGGGGEPRGKGRRGKMRDRHNGPDHDEFDEE